LTGHVVAVAARPDHALSKVVQAPLAGSAK
jgi:hypothetical protein